jgi:glucokinase
LAGRDLTAGVDLGGTKIQSVVVRGGEVVGSARTLTPQSGVAGDVIAAIVQTVHDSLERAAATTADLAAVGIGTPGEVDAEAGVVLLAANVPGFSARVELGPLVSEALGGVKAMLGNDVSVGVLGEFVRGAARPFTDVLGAWVGTGVGGGLILRGQLYDGRGAAGELGHMVVQPGGLACSCGRKGCLEAYAGRVRMERRARSLMKRGHKTVLFRIMEERGRERLTSGVFAAALEEGDRVAIRLVEDATRALGLGLASAQNLLDLEAIVIGGGLGDRLGQPFVDRVVEHMTPHLFAPEKPPQVLRTELGDLSGAVGAAVLAGG